MAARGNERLAVRERVRQRRLTLDAERRAREERIDEAVADFELAADARRDAQAALETAETQMGHAVAAVLAEGESLERAAALCDVTPAEVRRLAKLADNPNGKGRATTSQSTD